MTTQVYDTQYLVFGCGNTLFGNDGFGPEVVNEINANHTLPDSVLVLDAGTGIRDLVFDLLLVDTPPQLVIVVDAVTVENRKQGEVFEMEVSKMPREKLSDFSLHQSPSSNLLSQLAQRGIDVRVIAMNTEFIPNEISPGLCPEAKKAVEEAVQRIVKKLKSRISF